MVSISGNLPIYQPGYTNPLELPAMDSQDFNWWLAVQAGQTPVNAGAKSHLPGYVREDTLAGVNIVNGFGFNNPLNGAGASPTQAANDPFSSVVAGSLAGILDLPAYQPGYTNPLELPAMDAQDFNWWLGVQSGQTVVNAGAKSHLPGYVREDTLANVRILQPGGGFF